LRRGMRWFVMPRRGGSGGGGGKYDGDTQDGEAKNDCSGHKCSTF